MSGLLQPVGPEPARTYWIRRGILLAVVLVLLLLVGLAVANLTKAAVATAPPPPIAAATSPSPGPRSGATTSPTPSTGSSTAPTGTATASTGASSAPPAPSASTGGSASPSAQATATAKPTSTPKPTTSAASTPDCKPADLTVGLKGNKTPRIGKKVSYTVSVANSGEQTCLASVTDKNFELKIYSGTDRIWSSQDCGKTLDSFDKSLAPGASTTWTMTWNGRRSVTDKSCTSGSSKLQAGVYWATAQLDGAKPIQVRMTLS